MYLPACSGQSAVKSANYLVLCMYKSVFVCYNILDKRSILSFCSEFCKDEFVSVMKIA